MSLPTGTIQTGFITRYRGDTPLQGLLTGSVSPTWNIYDQNGVPTNQTFPYVVLFPIMSQSGTDLSFGTDAVDTFVQISVFTQAGGFAQARAIAKRIYDITQEHALDLSASSFNQYFLLFDDEHEISELDGITQQIAHRYRLMTSG